MSRRRIPFGPDHVEVWSQRVHGEENDYEDKTELFVLKFPGAGGRAERATAHPADAWPDCRAEIWTVNPPGYGGSPGRASLQVLAPAAHAVFGQLAREAEGRPIVVSGNSLGSASALHVAAHFDVDGLLLRNPPPLRQLIVGRHAWWTLGIGARLVARQVPAELCCIRNAQATETPALFVMSGKDRLVPPRYQRQIISAHRGPQRVLILPNADHASSMEEDQRRQYGQLLRWLRDTAFQRHRQRITASS